MGIRRNLQRAAEGNKNSNSYNTIYTSNDGNSYNSSNIYNSNSIVVTDSEERCSFFAFLN